MGETFSLKSSRDFSKVYKRGKSRANCILALYVLKNGREYNRVGISVSRRVGKSVVRNRVKRLIKEVYRKNSHLIKQGYDLVFVSRVQAAEADYHDVERWMADLMRRHGLL